ncbi:MAG: helix-turn-helix domain-containing protein [Patescibacteria group bacterium]
MTYEQHLVQAGLTGHEAALFEVLVVRGSMPASKAALQAGVPRTLAYKVLNDLLEKGLVEKKDEGRGVSRFSAVHPVKLQEMAEAKRRDAEQALKALEGALPELSSAFSLSIGRPGVKFYEGPAGIKRVLEDTLTAKETIYSYADLEMIERHIGDINRSYVAERERRGLKKKALLLDTPKNRELLAGYHITITDVKLMAAHCAPFKTVMQIYDGRISYFTLGTEHLVGVIITDPHIYEMHKALFEMLWESELAVALPVAAAHGRSSTE